MPGSTSGGAVSTKKQKQKQKGQAEYAGSSVIEALPWTPVIQGQVSSLPIVFTRDADFFFVAASSSVKIYSRITGQLVSTLSSAASSSSSTTWSGRQVTESHTAAITGLALNPANPLQLLTCSLDGTIKVWDYLDATLLRTIDLCFPISHMVAHSSIKGSVYVALRKPKNAESSEAGAVDPFNFGGRCNSIIQLVSLTTVSSKGSSATKAQSVSRVGKARQTTAMSLSADGRYLVLIGKRKVHVARTAALQDGFSKVISDQELTCLAFHPENNTFATGDSVGQIRLWYFLDSDAASQKSNRGVQVAPSVLMHWHAHAVSALTFTPNGANLLSGGEESVMVLWQLATQNREYVPRLGGSSIKSITVLQGNQGREEEYVAFLGDGSISFVGAINLKANRTISQAFIDSTRQLLGKDYLKRVSAYPLAVQPGTNHLVMNAGHPSSLQFFDVEADRLITQMEIAPSNRVSRPDDVPLEPARVERVCFSAMGDWMATIDGRGGGECSLKVWRWDAKLKTYVLNSRIEEPHQQGKVTSMSFSPRALSEHAARSSTSLRSSSSPLLLTTGTDNKARTWRKMTQEVKGGRKEEFWIARSAFDYRNRPIAHACWEPNGSLLAVAHDEGFVTLWEPVSNALQQVISFAGRARQVAFAGKGGRYVVAISDRCLAVWDIVFGRLAWEAEMSSDQVLVSNEDNFSVLCPKGASTNISTFSPRSSVALRQYQIGMTLRQVCSTSQGGQASSPLTPCFYALNNEYDVVRVGLGLDAELSMQGHAPQSLRGVSIKRRTLYDELIGPREEEKQAVAQMEPSSTFRTQRGTQVAGGMLDVASHLLPPMSVLYDPIVRQLLPPRRAEETTKPAPDAIVQGARQGKNDMEEEESTSEHNGGAAQGVDRLRQVSEMDWSSMAALFAIQATITPDKASNGRGGKANGGAAKVKSINGSAAAATPPKKSPRKSMSRASTAVNGASPSPKGDLNGRLQGNERKRKNVE